MSLGPSNLVRQTGPDTVQLNYAQLLPRLPAEVVAQFEAVSGLMIVNVTGEELVAAGQRLDAPLATDGQLFAAINHEMYHFFQTVATGYMFDHCSRIWGVVYKHMSRHSRADLADRFWQARQRLLGWLLSPFLGAWKDRWLGWAKLNRGRRQLAEMQAAAPAGDHSLVDAMMPELRGELDALRTRLDQANAQGLSPLHLIEGSALFYQYALSYYSSDWRAKLEQEWPTYDDTYRRAFEMAKAAIGERAYDVFLPATALALNYENPQNAFMPLAGLLAAMEDVAGWTRRIALLPPSLEGAGSYLGRASDVRLRGSRGQTQLKRYDEVLDTLRAGGWNLDEFDLLTDPMASMRVPSFPYGIVAQDSMVTAPRNRAETMAALLISNFVLGTASFPRMARDAEREQLDFILAGASNIFGP